MFVVYRGNKDDPYVAPLDAPTVWRYTAKDRVLTFFRYFDSGSQLSSYFRLADITGQNSEESAERSLAD
jgi:hypothetical protein